MASTACLPALTKVCSTNVLWLMARSTVCTRTPRRATRSVSLLVFNSIGCDFMWCSLSLPLSRQLKDRPRGLPQLLHLPRRWRVAIRPDVDLDAVTGMDAHPRRCGNSLRGCGAGRFSFQQIFDRRKGMSLRLQFADALQPLKVRA